MNVPKAILQGKRFTACWAVSFLLTFVSVSVQPSTVQVNYPQRAQTEQVVSANQVEKKAARYLSFFITNYHHPGQLLTAQTVQQLSRMHSRHIKLALQHAERLFIAVRLQHTLPIPPSFPDEDHLI
ncbi:MAG: hypothetical protein JNM57_15565 [Cyclobacteriaceae bacterium]|nr:hypothetical protein [Cyclobacteriaceae bacterium]